MGRIAVFFASLLVLGQPAHAVERGCPAAAVSFNILGVSNDEAGRFKRDFCAALDRVRAWWGPTFPGPFKVEVDPDFRISKALTPGWRGNRGRAEFPARRVADREAATIHEVVHIFAPNANRFLAEGLAVHAHQALGGNPAYPNSGAALDGLARGYAEKADLAVLDAVATPTRLEIPGRLDGRKSYIVAGSFVGFLIAAHGLEKFRELYALTPMVPGKRAAGRPDRWRKVYGASLRQLDTSWRRSIGALAGLAPVVPAPASTGLSGKQIRKMLVGNTTRVDVRIRGNSVRVWTYYPDAKTYITRTARGSGNGSWSVTTEGVFCKQSARFGKRCWTDVTRIGDAIRMKRTDMPRERSGVLIPGNPEGL